MITALFALFIISLPRYTDHAKLWFVLLILTAFIYLVANVRQLSQTSNAERALFAVVALEFIWIAFTYYLNGEPGRGASFVWSRHFYMLFLIPMFFLFRRFEISDKAIVILLFCSVLFTFTDIVIDLAQKIDHRAQGMNPNKLGPIQLSLSGILLFYYLKRPDQKIRWLALIGFFLGIATVFFSQSKTTWVSMAVLVVLFTFYLISHRPVMQRVFIAAAVLLILSSSYSFQLVKFRVDHGLAEINAYFASADYRDDSRKSSVGVRIELWKTAWYIFLEHPVTGAGVGGFHVMARENSERYQVNKNVGDYKYVHNQYLAALSTRGLPGLILFLLFLSLPIYIAMSRKSFDRDSEFARLSVLFICITYLIGCLGEDHFEGKSATMFVSVFLALLLARISKPNRESDI